MPLLQQLENGDGGSKLALEIFVETDNAAQNMQAGPLDGDNSSNQLDLALGCCTIASLCCSSFSQ